jgi:hypothetical protein
MVMKTVVDATEKAMLHLLEYGNQPHEHAEFVARAAVDAYRESVASEAVAYRWKYKGENYWLAATLGETMTFNYDEFDVEPLFAGAPKVLYGEFNKIVNFFVQHGMLDRREEYDISDIMGALKDNYEPAAPAASEGWRPIATAPKHGEFLIADYAPTTWTYNVRSVTIREGVGDWYRENQIKYARAWMPRPAAPKLQFEVLSDD